MFRTIGVICVGVAISSIGGGWAAWNIQTNKIDAITKEYSLLKSEIRLQAEAAEKELKEKKELFENALRQADENYKDAVTKLNIDINSLRKQRDSARSDTMSRIAESSRVPDELCFSRAGFESAIQQLDESLSGIIGQCLDTETRLTIARDWYNTIKNIE